MTPLAHPRHRRPAPSARDPEAAALAPFARSDLLLNSSQWSSQVVGKTSPWWGLTDPARHVEGGSGGGRWKEEEGESNEEEEGGSEEEKEEEEEEEQ